MNFARLMPPIDISHAARGAGFWLKCRRHGGACLLALSVFIASAEAEFSINGFKLDDCTVPAEHIVRAAPAKDSIHALDETKWTTAAENTLLADGDEVLSVTLGGETRAYPLKILVWHEVVNDRVGDTPLVVTYCALTGSAMAFDPGANADGTTRTFGVSGLLYNSGLLMYDRATESLWSQLMMTGISHAAMDVELKPLASRRLKWSSWKQEYPAGKVLSVETGYDNDYGGEWPYGTYSKDEAAMFPFDINRDEFATKDRMIAISERGAQRAWPLATIKRKKQVFDAIGSRPVNVVYNEKTDDVTVTDISTGEPQPAVSVYWFAWQACYPDTSVWQPLK